MTTRLAVGLATAARLADWEIQLQAATNITNAHIHDFAAPSPTCSIGDKHFKNSERRWFTFNAEYFVH